MHLKAMLVIVVSLLMLVGVGVTLVPDFSVYPIERSPEIEEVYERTRQREAIADELLAGHLTLLEAAAKFNAVGPNQLFQVKHPDASVEELSCRHLIEYAKGRAIVTCPQKTTFVKSLKQEFEERVRNGTLHFPADAATP